MTLDPRSPTLLRARIVLPVARPPIEDGAVLLSAGRIATVGRWKDVPRSKRGLALDLGEAILLPGLVNAHCHLDYTTMAGQFQPPKYFTDWLKLITTSKSGWTYSDFAESWLAGAKMLLRTGTTTIADVEMAPELLPEVWTATPLRVFSFLEMTGIKSRRPPGEIMREAMEKIGCLPAARAPMGLSPHAPYSTTPALLRLAARTAREKNLLLVTHVAESGTEFEMFKQGRGEMFDWLARNQRDMSDCGLGSPVQHLERHGLLGQNLMAVHANYLAPGDAQLLGERNVSVVHCPRSHGYFRHRDFPLAELSAAGVNVCLGTDSLASVYETRKRTVELNMFEEMRQLATTAPTLAPETILRMATLNGARALGMEGRIGELSPGAFADLIAIPHAGKIAESHGALLQHRGNVSASMIDGQWAIPFDSPMTDFINELNLRLGEIREQGLYRELRRVDSPQSTRLQIAGKSLLNFSSNDYLGLASHPLLKEAAIKAVEQFGSGSGASRLICGSLAPHHELENAIADFKGVESALSFSSGYAAAMGAICALLGKDDVIVLDKLVHACIVDAARLCGAKLRIFAHNDLGELEDILRWADQRNANDPAARRSRTLIVTESVFSMDGDIAPLRDLAALKEKHGAWLMVDEAHATGLFGAHRRGLAEEFMVSDQIEIQMGTLGKALGAAGGYVCGSRVLTDYLVNRARTFIFSTAPVPAAAAAARAAIDLLQSAEGQARRNQAWALVDQLKTGLIQASWPLPVIRSLIVPLVIGEETKAMTAAAILRDAGIFIPAIRYPTVARNEARLRLTLTAAHTPADVSELVAALGEIIRNPQSAIRNA